MTALQIAVGSVLAASGWWLTRWVAGAPLRMRSSLVLDAALPVSVFAALVAASARPGFAGAATLALGAGFAFSDWRKRAALAEPIVVSDVFLSRDIFRHPAVAVPFPDTARVMSGVGVAVAACTALYVLETPAWNWTPWPVLALLTTVLVLMWVLSGPLNAVCGKALRRLQPTGDPTDDGAAFGSIATLLIYGIVARAERAQLRAPAGVPVAMHRCQPRLAPLVLVQCESFFDVRRVHPSVYRDLLPNLDRRRGESLQWGHLTVPSWGANTVRTEFAVLTGMPETAIGFDKFNPYQAFARAPIQSLVWELRAQGYRTVCVHPFDRRFYGRDKVMRNLGFDEFLGEEAFAGAQRIGAFVADVEVARFVAELLAQQGNDLFVFAVTMENHGPWPAEAAGRSAGAAAVRWHDFALPAAEQRAFTGFLEGVRNADAMLGMLSESLARHAPGGLLAMYGDHLPSFPETFRSLGFADRRSDYLLWRANNCGAGMRKDLAAQHLMGDILAASPRTQAIVTRTESLA